MAVSEKYQVEEQFLSEDMVLFVNRVGELPRWLNTSAGQSYRIGTQETVQAGRSQWPSITRFDCVCRENIIVTSFIEAENADTKKIPTLMGGLSGDFCREFFAKFFDREIVRCITDNL